MSDAGDSGNRDARERTDPYRRHRFRVDVEGLERFGVTEIRGLAVTVEGASSQAADTDDDRQWGEWLGVGDHILDRQSGTPAYETTTPNLELRRGVTDDSVLWDWLQDWVAGGIEPRTVSVYLLDEAGTTGIGWVCADAKPVKWTGPKLRTDKPGVAMETLELAHEGISAADVSGDATQ